MRNDSRPSEATASNSPATSRRARWMAATSEYMAQMTRHPKILGPGKILFREQRFEELPRPALMRHHPGKPVGPAQGDHLHRQSADIHADARHHSTSGSNEESQELA
jgi:hypothetical protein